MQTKKIIKNNFEFISHSESDTKNFACDFAKNLKPGQIILLNGDLGTGKTVFMRGIGKYFGVENLIRSPSFTLINEYETKSEIYLIHADLYRLDNFSAESLGLDEYFYNDDVIIFIEWPDRLNYLNMNGEKVIKIYFEALNENERRIKFKYFGD